MAIINFTAKNNDFYRIFDNEDDLIVPGSLVERKKKINAADAGCFALKYLTCFSQLPDKVLANSAVAAVAFPFCCCCHYSFCYSRIFL